MTRTARRNRWPNENETENPGITGLEEMKNGICTKCGHTEVIRAKAADYAGDSQEKEMSVTADPRWVMPGRNPAYPHGRLYLYTCRSCGYTEWYATKPEQIPIGEDYRTEIV